MLVLLERNAEANLRYVDAEVVMLPVYNITARRISLDLLKQHSKRQTRYSQKLPVPVPEVPIYITKI
jgi:hypothetical protein